MGTVHLLGRTLSSLGYMARQLLVAFRPCSNIRYLHHQESEVGILEEDLQRG